MNSIIKLFYIVILGFLVFGTSCFYAESSVEKNNSIDTSFKNPYIIILGIAQDGGYPQANCKKQCCKEAWTQPKQSKMVSCIGLVDPLTNETWMFDATPDFKNQLKDLSLNQQDTVGYHLNGVFLTHGHVGHYTGLMHLGREVMGAKNINVFAMPRMKDFLINNGPWSQLVSLNNISIQLMAHEEKIVLNERISVTPFLVPHRDEFTETVGYQIKGPSISVVFIPDIDKWEKWDSDILEIVRENDILLIDGTFFKNGELKGVDMSLIPHPFIEESMKLFEPLPEKEKSKIYFIHFNHTNPVLIKGSEAYKMVEDAGFHIAQEKEIIKL